MRSLLRSKKSVFATLTALSASVLVIAACSGGKPPGDTKTPGGDGTATPTEGASSGGGTSASSSGGAASSGGASGGGTTTTALGDGGDLQGAKLGTSSHTEVETKGDGGKPIPHAQEPGRKREDIQTIVMARRDDARACYDKGLKDHPGIEGDLTVKFVIDPQGTVSEASIDSSKSTILEPSVGNCIIEIIKKIKFAPSKLGFETRANYPYNFHPKTFGGAKPDAGK